MLSGLSQEALQCLILMATTSCTVCNQVTKQYICARHAAKMAVGCQSALFSYRFDRAFASIGFCPSDISVKLLAFHPVFEEFTIHQ